MAHSSVHRAAARVLLAATAALATAGSASATILSFDWTREAATGSVVPTVSPSFLPVDYGDHVTGPSVAVPGGSFVYGQGGEGYTPNVSIDIAGGGATATDAHVRLWAQGFGDLQNVVFGLPASQEITVRLAAEPGFEAALYGFDLGGYPGSDWVINSVQVFAGPSLLFSQVNALIEGAGPGSAHTAFEFASPLVGSELLLRIDYSNLAPSRQDNIGLDNLRFGQWPPSAIPEPGTAGLLSMGLLLGWMRWRNASRRPRLLSCAWSSKDAPGRAAMDCVEGATKVRKGRRSLALLSAALVSVATAPAQAASCAANPVPGCLYAPPAYYSVDRSEAEVIYTDVAGQPRHVPIAIRRPLGATAPLPVVIWSHGGAEGHRNPRRSLAEWSEATAQAGYLTISLAHGPRGANAPVLGNTRQSLCTAIAAAAASAAQVITWDLSRREACREFKYLNWDRPHDIRAVLDELERMNLQGPLRGQIDLARIAIAGHSAGAGGALTVGGALRNFTGEAIDLSDPRRRAKAFIALSPQQQGNEGFFDTDYKRPTHSWVRLQRPVLMASGDGDSTCQPLSEPGSCYGDTPWGRRGGFERMPAGDKALLYFNDARVFHGLFALETGDDKCIVSPDAQRRCDKVAQVLRATAIAFLDGHLLARPLAQQWLAGQDAEVATQGVAQWLRR